MNTPVEYPEPDKDKASSEALLHEPDRYTGTWPCALSPQKAVPFLSSAWPTSSFEVVADQGFCRSFGYFLHVYRNGQR